VRYDTAGQSPVKHFLLSSRDLAEKEFRERTETTAALPAIYSVMMNQIMRQSAEAMQNLSDEDRKKMDEILAKSREDSTTDEDTTEDQSE
jgi:hypothetical protein